MNSLNNSRNLYEIFRKFPEISENFDFSYKKIKFYPENLKCNSQA